MTLVLISACTLPPCLAPQDDVVACFCFPVAPPSHGDEDKGDDDQEEEQEELGLAPERRATSTTSSTFHLTDASAVGPQGGRAAGLPLLPAN